MNVSHVVFVLKIQTESSNGDLRDENLNTPANITFNLYTKWASNKYFFRRGHEYNLYINLACLSVCLFVCLYPINIKTAEPIGPKFFVGSRGTPGKVYGGSIFKKFASIKIRILKILKIHEMFLKIREIFCFYYLLTRRSPVYFIFTNEIKYRREAP